MPNTLIDTTITCPWCGSRIEEHDPELAYLAATNGLPERCPATPSQVAEKLLATAWVNGLCAGITSVSTGAMPRNPYTTSTEGSRP